jgi:hypothetical protein
MPKKLTQEEFIEKAKAIHGERYDYSNVVYVNTSTKVLLGCPVHGDFLIKPNSHLSQGAGCAKCASTLRGNNNKTTTTDSFIEKARLVHGDKYDYSRIEYVRPHAKMTIICPVHGAFQQTSVQHTSGKHGCMKCGSARRANTTRKTTEIVVGEFMKHHGDKYDYSSVEYVSGNVVVDIICPEHGVFQQRPNKHRTGNGCPLCGQITSGLAQRLTQTEVIGRSSTKHGDKYDYSKVEYITSDKKITIICPKHGEFSQRPIDHYMHGNGCPKCSHVVSKGEQEVADFVESLGVHVEQSNRTLITPYELDIIIPTHNIAIEYCGLYWHSEQQGKDRNYHKNKQQACANNNVQLLTIYEDEWFNTEQQVKNKIKHLVGLSDGPRVYARNCVVGELTKQQSVDFLNDNHIQGSGPGSIRYGLFFNQKLVACMTFSKKTNNEWYLTRYATSSNCIGGFSKLLKHFQRHQKWSRLVSFADLRWSDGKLYSTTGWELDSTIPADYYYSPDGCTRSHKFNYRRKNLSKLLDVFDPDMSEWENCKANGILRIWDCGKLRFVINNNEWAH